MAELPHNILRKAREAQNYPRWKVAQEIGVSPDTIGRWETGEAIPSYDDLGRFGDVVHDPDLPHKYYLEHSEYYRKRFHSYEANILPLAAVKMRYKLDDLQQLQDAFERDAFDGKLDDPTLTQTYSVKLKALISAATEMLGKLM